MLSLLAQCPSIGGRQISRNDICRALIIDNAIVKFTPTEYRLIALLLEGRVIADGDLIREVFACDKSHVTLKNLDRHINNIRGKLRLSGLNIHRVAKYGYVLLDSFE